MTLSSFVSVPGGDALIDIASILHVDLEQVIRVFMASIIHCLMNDFEFQKNHTKSCTFTCELQCNNEYRGVWGIIFERIGGSYLITHEVYCSGMKTVRAVNLTSMDYTSLSETLRKYDYFNVPLCVNHVDKDGITMKGKNEGKEKTQHEVANEFVKQALGIGFAPPAVNALFKYLHSNDVKSPLNVAMSNTSLIADFAMAFIGAPGSGKTTIAYWIAYTALLKLMTIAKQVLRLSINVEELDLGRALRALHPRSLEELVRLINYGESCRRLPLLFIDDAVPTWWSINASRVGRQFYSKFMSYYRNWAGMVFMTTQYKNVLKALPIPRYYVTLNTAQGVIEIVWFRRLARAVNTAVGTTNVMSGYTLHKALIPYDPSGVFKLPPDFEEDSRLAKANFRRVYTARELERILMRDNADCNIEDLQEESTDMIIDTYNKLLRLRESGRLSTQS